MSSSANSLRPMNLGELLDRTFFLYRKHFLLFVGITALPHLLLLAVQIFDAIFLTRPTASSFSFLGANIASAILQLILMLFIGAASQSATVNAVSRLYLGGQASVAEAYAGVMGRIPIVAGMMIAISVAAAAGLVLCIVPGVFLWLMWSLTIPVAILERRGLFDAASRSAQLTEGWRGRVFVIYVLYSVLLYIFTLLWQVPVVILGLLSTNGDPIAMPTWVVILSAIGTLFSSCLATPLLTVALSLVYYNQRVTKEAFDLQHMMSMLDDVAPASTS